MDSAVAAGSARAAAGSHERLARVTSRLAFTAVRVLMRVAPEPSATQRRAPGRSHPVSGAVIGWFRTQYQRSPLRDRLKAQGNECVYLPTCTEYAHRAVLKHGLYRGLMLTGDRFRRCAEGGRGSYLDFP